MQQRGVCRTDRHRRRGEQRRFRFGGFLDRRHPPGLCGRRSLRENAGESLLGRGRTCQRLLPRGHARPVGRSADGRTVGAGTSRRRWTWPKPCRDTPWRKRTGNTCWASASRRRSPRAGYPLGGRDNKDAPAIRAHRLLPRLPRFALQQMPLRAEKLKRHDSLYLSFLYLILAQNSSSANPGGKRGEEFEGGPSFPPQRGMATHPKDPFLHHLLLVERWGCLYSKSIRIPARNTVPPASIFPYQETMLLASG